MNSVLEDKVGPQPDFSRRLLITGAFGAAFALLAQKSEAQNGSRSTDPASSWVSPTNRLVRRITYGLTEEQVQLAQSSGYEAYLESQINHQAIDDSEVTTAVATKYPRLSWAITQLFDSTDDWVTKEQLINATLYRAAFSKKQLYERMVEFWSDHFNVWTGKVNGYLKVVDDQQVIRPHAMGKVPDLMRASGHSPAMLAYLDNDPSELSAPSQNYARELLELHTMGVNGGYTQNDVLEVARCLTGWSYRWETTHPSRGQFVYRSQYHDNGAKTVLGVSIPAGGGQTDGDKVFDILVSHPSTAQFISRKMARWLLRYDPPQTLVNAVAQIYLNTGGDIPSMIREILKQPNLMAAPAKYKRPNQMYISLMRSLKVTFTNFDHLRWTYLESAGHVPFDWPAPNGYPDDLDYWAGFILPRWRFGFDLAAGWVGGMTYSVSTLLANTPTAQAVVDRINVLMFGGEMLPKDKADLLAYVQAGTLNNTRRRAAVALAAASPSFQWY